MRVNQKYDSLQLLLENTAWNQGRTIFRYRSTEALISIIDCLLMLNVQPVEKGRHRKGICGDSKSKNKEG
jgi:hypothetical protein